MAVNRFAQRMGPLTGIPVLLAEFGVTLDQAIDGLPIDRAAFDDPSHHTSFATASAMLERCAVITRCPHFGLLLGARSALHLLGPPGAMMQHSPTLGSAFDSFCAYQHSNSRGATVYLHRSGENWILGYAIYASDARAHVQIHGLVAAVMVRGLGELTGGSVRALDVLLSVRQPADTAPFAAILKTPVRFNQPETGIVLARAALDAPVVGARPEELARLRQRAEALVLPSGRIWSDRVKHAIRPLLLRGEASGEIMASELGISVRTLARRLEKEDTSFQRLLDEVRYTMARELLEATELPVGEIADALCYASPSNFGEAFRRWSGVTATEWRSALRQSAVA